MSEFNNFRIMIFDDDTYMAKLLETILLTYEIRKIEMVENLADAKLLLQSSKVDCILMEWHGWEKPSLELLAYVRKSGEVANPKLPVIMCTGYTDYKHVIKARDIGANEIVAKPYSPAHVYEKLHSAMYKVREFIAEDSFTGPDRRRNNRVFGGKERRVDKALPQSEIDKLMGKSDE